jgi:sodium/pantothenate symporter
LSFIRIGSTWVIGVVALYWAFSPPELISQFYTAGVGVLSASLFVPTVAGLWWKKANLAGGVGAVLSGAVVYVLVQVGVIDVGLAPVVVALAASAAAMLLGGLLGPAESAEMIGEIEALHV